MQLCQQQTHFDVLVRKELMLAVDKAIKSLPPYLRKVFEARHLEEMRYKEIAASFGITVATVKSNLKDAMKRVRQDLMKFM
jgi:RNA polymerase sigma factor (sigma-70 family)